MKKVVLALAVAVFVFALCVFFLWLAISQLLDQQPMKAFAFAITGSSPVLSLFVYVHQALEREELPKPQAPTLPTHLVTLENFTLPWHVMILYGAFILAGSVQFVGFLLGFFIAMTSISPELAQKNIGPVATALAMLSIPTIACFLGAWVGTRCNKYKIGVVIAVVFFGRVLATAIDFLLPSPLFKDVIGAPKSFATFLMSLAPLPFLSVSTYLWVAPLGLGLIGLWWGQRLQLSRYLRYLLYLLPSEDRRAVVDLAYDGAQNAQTRNSANYSTPVNG